MSAQGLENKLETVVRELNDARTKPFDPVAKKWKPTTLSGYLKDRKLTKQHLYAGLGIDARATQMSELFNDPNKKFLVNEIIYDACLRGMGLQEHTELSPVTQSNDITNPLHRIITPEFIRPFITNGAYEQAFYQDFVAGQVPSPMSTTPTVPFLEMKGIKTEDVAEGANIPTGSYAVSRKTVELTKVGTGIEATDESLQTSTIQIFATFMEAVGRAHAAKKNAKAMAVIVNGNPSTGDSAPVIGVTTANSLVNRDIYRARQRMSLLQVNPSVIAAEEETGLDYLELPAVQAKQFTGNALLPTQVRFGVLGNATYYATFDLAAGKILLHDPTFAIMEYVFSALKVETDRVVNRQITGEYITEQQGFAKQARWASLIVDKTLAFSGNGFPTYMSPINRQ